MEPTIVSRNSRKVHLCQEVNDGAEIGEALVAMNRLVRQSKAQLRQRAFRGGAGQTSYLLGESQMKKAVHTNAGGVKGPSEGSLQGSWPTLRY